jgi:hypothetical protein
MTAGNRYTVLEVVRGAIIHSCVDCGALVFYRSRHDAWHEYQQATALAAALVAAAGGDVERP